MGSKNGGTNFEFFYSEKFGDGWMKCLSQFYEFDQDQTSYIFWRGVAQPSGRVESDTRSRIRRQTEGSQRR